MFILDSTHCLMYAKIPILSNQLLVVKPIITMNTTQHEFVFGRLFPLSNSKISNSFLKNFFMLFSSNEFREKVTKIFGHKIDFTIFFIANNVIALKRERPPTRNRDQLNLMHDFHGDTTEIDVHVYQTRQLIL